MRFKIKYRFKWARRTSWNFGEPRDSIEEALADIKALARRRRLQEVVLLRDSGGVDHPYNKGRFLMHRIIIHQGSLHPGCQGD